MLLHLVCRYHQRNSCSQLPGCLAPLDEGETFQTNDLPYMPGQPRPMHRRLNGPLGTSPRLGISPRNESRHPHAKELLPWFTYLPNHFLGPNRVTPNTTISVKIYPLLQPHFEQHIPHPDHRINNSERTLPPRTSTAPLALSDPLHPLVPPACTILCIKDPQALQVLQDHLMDRLNLLMEECRKSRTFRMHPSNTITIIIQLPLHPQPREIKNRWLSAANPRSRSVNRNLSLGRIGENGRYSSPNA